MGNKKTLVIGASTNPARYSNLAIHALRRHGIEVVALAKREGKVADVNIGTKFPVQQENIHTVTMYIGPRNQPEYYELICTLRPQRVIFNPGTENPEFESKLETSRIEVVVACTLNMLDANQY